MNILIVGCGAVAHVMLQTLHKISVIHHLNLHFFILSRSDKSDKDLQDLGLPYTLIVESDFQNFFDKLKPCAYEMHRAINTADPSFNTSMLARCAVNQCHYMDLASNLTEQDVIAGNVEQIKFDEEYKKSKLKAIVNAGISPGMTELLIAYTTRLYHLDPTDIVIKLQENFNCIKPLFSWSPRVAIQEVLTPAIWMQDTHRIHGGLFENQRFADMDGSGSKDYIRLTQEELVSIHSAYPHISNLSMFAGGSEIEQSRLLYNLGVLQDTHILDLIRKKLPSAAHKQEMIDAYHSGGINDAGFQAHIDIQDTHQNKQIYIHFDYIDFCHIQETSYAGATSISYPTGIAASWIWYLAHCLKQEYGVYNCIELGQMTSDVMLREVIHHMDQAGIHIDLSS